MPLTQVPQPVVSRPLEDYPRTCAAFEAPLATEPARRDYSGTAGTIFMIRTVPLREPRTARGTRTLVLPGFPALPAEP